MNSPVYFDAHLHLESASDAGLDALLTMVESDVGCMGGNLIVNTARELDVLLRRIGDIPPWLQLVPCLDFADQLPNSSNCGWVKLHPSLQRIRHDDVPDVVARTQLIARRLEGVIVHCFPWGSDREFNSSLELVTRLAESLPERWILATHGGGYESWAYRAHVGGFKNVLFDFSVSLSYYAGSDLLRPLQRYLIHSPDRVLFGTDWPSGTRAEQWGEMLIWAKGAGLDNDRLEDLMMQNSRRTWPQWKPRT